MPTLEIRGKEAYVKRMKKHLAQEHPSTRQRMRIIPQTSLSHAKVMAGFMKTQNFKPRIFKSTTVLRNKDFNKKFPYVICCEKRKRM